MSECKSAINQFCNQNQKRGSDTHIQQGFTQSGSPTDLKVTTIIVVTTCVGQGTWPGIPCWKIALAQIIALIRWRSIMAMAKVKNRPGRSRTPPTLPNPLSLCLTDPTQSFTGLGIILKKIIYSSPSLRLPFWPFSYISNRMGPLYYTCTHASNNVILIVLAIWPVATTALGQSCIL